MRQRRIYLLHPQDRFLPVVSEWVAEVREILQSDEQWSGWDLCVRAYSLENSFNVRDIFSLVQQAVGPVVLLQPVQTRPRELLRQALRRRSIVHVESAFDSTDIYRVLDEARSRFESGEPYLPRRYAAAVLIVRKLAAGHYWGGNAKGYLFANDLAKGRGVPEQFADIAPRVANDLLLKGILIKKPSGGKTKYALNPELKPEVYAIVQKATFHNEALNRVLTKDTKEVSARILDSST